MTMLIVPNIIGIVSRVSVLPSGPSVRSGVFFVRIKWFPLSMMALLDLRAWLGRTLERQVMENGMRARAVARPIPDDPLIT
jgi:hypothetical protein